MGKGKTVQLRSNIIHSEQYMQLYLLMTYVHECAITSSLSEQITRWCGDFNKLTYCHLRIMPEHLRQTTICKLCGQIKEKKSH